MELRPKTCTAAPRRFSTSIFGSLNSAMSEASVRCDKGQKGSVGTKELLVTMKGCGVSRNVPKCQNACITEQLATMMAHMAGNEY